MDEAANQKIKDQKAYIVSLYLALEKAKSGRDRRNLTAIIQQAKKDLLQMGGTI